MARLWTKLSRVYLYDDPDSQGLDVDALAGWLAERLPGVEVGVRTHFLTYHIGRLPGEVRDQLTEELAKQLDRAEVDDLVHPAERGSLPRDDPAALGLGPIYRGVALQAIYRLLIPEEESYIHHLHIVFTAHAIGDWDEETRDFELKIAVLGAPTIISTTGLIEVPLKPKRYEFMRAQLAMMGLEEDLDDLAEEFADKALGYGDPRLNECLKGYVLMALFYRMYGEGPCGERGCRLYDAPTQEELIRTQCGPRAGLCKRHREMFEEAGYQP